MNPPELLHVSSYHGQVMHQRDRSNLQIHGTDDATSLLQIMANHSITIRTWIIEWQRDRTAQGPCDIHFPGIGIVVFFRAMHEFRANGRACHQLRGWHVGKFVNQSKVFALEHLNPDIRVEQVAHHQVLAGGNGSSGGSSNSLSAQHPMMSAKSGRLRLISSKVGNSFPSTTSEIASRTRDSSTRAFSGARRSKVRSSSNAIVVTGRHCHCATKNSTTHFQIP